MSFCHKRQSIALNHTIPIEYPQYSAFDDKSLVLSTTTTTSQAENHSYCEVYETGLRALNHPPQCTFVYNSENPLQLPKHDNQHKPVKFEPAAGKKILLRKSTKDDKKGPVDTSNFSIEERLVAAVWAHERKRTKRSIGQIKRDFQQRFERKPPTKNTLLVWEQKLFSTGSVHDAPRPGRPAKRGAGVAAVLASVQGSPGLSQRARARALSMPRTTLRSILTRDLGQSPTNKQMLDKETRSLKH